MIGPAPLINHEYIRRLVQMVLLSKAIQTVMGPSPPPRCLSLGLNSVRLHLVPRLDVKRDFPRESCDDVSIFPLYLA